MYDQLEQYFSGQGYEGVQLDREVSRVLSQITCAHQQPVRDSVNVAVTNTMETQTQGTVYPSPDMVPIPDSEIIDLGFDVSEADVARPVLRAASLAAVISFVRQEKSRVKGLPQLLVGYRLTEPAKTIDGKEVGAGFTIVQRILMEPSGKYTEEMRNDRLKRIHFAAVGPGWVTTAGWVGKPVRVRITMREPHRDETTGEEYDASNDVGGVYPPTKSA